MIICNLAGGLGNQMFQYSAAKNLSKILSLPLKFSIKSLVDNDCNHNGMELEKIFNIDIELASELELKKYLGFIYYFDIRLTRYLLKFKSIKYFLKNIIIEGSVADWPKLQSLALGGGFMYGYWQSENYFSQINNDIIKDFTFPNPINFLNMELEKEISNSNSVGLHIRRGDYLSVKKNINFHGVCSIEYYHAAIKLMLSRNPDAKFFVFSDDHQWIYDELLPHYPAMIVVKNNHDANNYIDMKLMSLCKHNIIANSSFSWWAAWLNANPNKIIIAPIKWFANEMNSNDLIPKSWIRI